MKKVITLLFVSAMLFTSCSKNEEDVKQEEQLSSVVMKDFKENINNLSIPSALSSSSNSYAQQANAQFQALKGIAQSYTTLLTIPPNAVTSRGTSRSSNNTQTYTWFANGVTIEYTITESSDRYNFSYTIDGNGVSGKIMDGYQLKDGSYAEARLYDSGVVVSVIKWWLEGDKVKIEVSADTSRIVLESNTSNNAGNIKLYESNSLLAEYNWQADGSGTYIDHVNNQTYSW